MESSEPPIAGPAGFLAARWIFLAIGAITVVGLASTAWLVAQPDARASALASDPLLRRGLDIYRASCVACHGPDGRGDGPLSRSLTGPPPRNLAQDPWKHGDRPDQVLAVLADGVRDAQMPTWSGTYNPDDLKAVAAYVYWVAGKPVPDAWRVR